MRKFLKVLYYGVIGFFLFLTILAVIALGAAGGAYWYFSRHAEFRLEATYYIQDSKGEKHPITVNLFSDSVITKEDLKRMFKEGNIQGDIQIYGGPGDFKLIGARMALQVPFEEIMDTIIGKIMGSLGFEGMVAQQVFGSDVATKTLEDILRTERPETLSRLLGPQYEKVLNDLFAGSRDKTLEEVFVHDFDRVTEVMAREVPKETLAQGVEDLLGERANVPLTELLRKEQDPQFKEVVESLAESYDPKLTIKDIFLQNPGEVIQKAKEALQGKILEQFFQGFGK